MVKITKVFLFLLLASNAFSRNVVDGYIDTQVTWGLSGSPYTIVQGVTVGNGGELTIEPGTVIINSDGSHGLYINAGNLICLGTEAMPIVFTSENPPPGEYGSYYAALGFDDVTNVQLSYVEFENAEHGIYVFFGELMLDHLEFRNCYFGIYNYTGGVSLSDCSFNNCAGGVSLDQGVGSSMIRCSFVGNHTGISRSSIAPRPSVVDCFFQGNHFGIYQSADVSGSTFLDHSYAAIYLNRSGNVSGCTFAESGYSHIKIIGAVADFIQITDNNLPNQDGFSIRLAGDNTATTIDATGNYWGTSNPEEINEMIHDAQDDPALFTEVIFTPFSDIVGTESVSWSDVKAMFR